MQLLYNVIIRYNIAFRLWGACLALCLYLLFPAQTLASSTLTTITSESRGGDTRFTISLSNQQEFKVFSLENPYRLVIDIKNTSWKAGAAPTGRGPVTNIRHGIQKGTDLRVVFDLAQPLARYNTFVLQSDKGQSFKLAVDVSTDFPTPAYKEIPAPKVPAKAHNVQKPSNMPLAPPVTAPVTSEKAPVKDSAPRYNFVSKEPNAKPSVATETPKATSLPPAVLIPHPSSIAKAPEEKKPSTPVDTAAKNKPTTPKSLTPDTLQDNILPMPDKIASAPAVPPVASPPAVKNTQAPKEIVPSQPKNTQKNTAKEYVSEPPVPSLTLPAAPKAIPPVAAPLTASKSATPAVSSQTTRANPVAAPTPKTRPGKSTLAAPDYKPLIVIDPGHGGHDPGATGSSGTLEKHVTLSYALALENALLETGKYRVLVVRRGDYFIKLHERVNKARQAKGDLFISLHADSHNDTKTKGLSVYTVSEKASDREAESLANKANKSDVIYRMDLDQESDDVADLLIQMAQRDTKNRSSSFAEKVAQELGKDINLLNNAHRFAGFRVLMAPDIPSILIELGYLSNRIEEQLLRTTNYKEKIVQSLVRAVDSYFVQFPVQKE